MPLNQQKKNSPIQTASVQHQDLPNTQSVNSNIKNIKRQNAVTNKQSPLKTFQQKQGEKAEADNLLNKLKYTEALKAYTKERIQNFIQELEPIKKLGKLGQQQAQEYQNTLRAYKESLKDPEQLNEALGLFDKLIPELKKLCKQILFKERKINRDLKELQNIDPKKESKYRQALERLQGSLDIKVKHIDDLRNYFKKLESSSKYIQGEKEIELLKITERKKIKKLEKKREKLENLGYQVNKSLYLDKDKKENLKKQVKSQKAQLKNDLGFCLDLLKRLDYIGLNNEYIDKELANLKDSKTNLTRYLKKAQAVKRRIKKLIKCDESLSSDLKEAKTFYSLASELRERDKEKDFAENLKNLIQDSYERQLEEKFKKEQLDKQEALVEKNNNEQKTFDLNISDESQQQKNQSIINLNTAVENMKSKLEKKTLTEKLATNNKEDDCRQKQENQTFTNNENNAQDWKKLSIEDIVEEAPPVKEALSGEVGSRQNKRSCPLLELNEKENCTEEIEKPDG